MNSNYKITDFQILSVLGTGAFSTVYKVVHVQSNQIYALKQIKLDKLSSREFKNSWIEIKLLSQLNSPFIVKFYSSFKQQNILNIVTEYLDGGNLQTQLNQHKTTQQQFLEDEIWHYFVQILLGVHIMHSNNILHRDLKCSNIILYNNKNSIKICDFNVSKQLVDGQELTDTTAGTPNYQSPEILNHKQYTKSTDIWSMGIIIYTLAALEHPFQSKTLKELVLKISLGKYQKIPANYSQELETILQCCLQRDPSKRLTTNQLLNMPIIQKKLDQFGLMLYFQEKCKINSQCKTSRLLSGHRLNDSKENIMPLINNNFPKTCKNMSNLQLPQLIQQVKQSNEFYKQKKGNILPVLQVRQQSSSPRSMKVNKMPLKNQNNKQIGLALRSNAFQIVKQDGSSQFPIRSPKNQHLKFLKYR